MAVQESKKSGLMSRRIILGTTIGGAIIFFITGIIFWGGFNTAMEATNTLEFCVSCHEMEENVYEEYKPTIHYSNRTGVRAACSDCHVPDPWVHKMVRKIKASNEVFHKIMGTVDTPEKFDQHRLTMAKRVWKTMKETDSRECRNCHNFESMNPEFQAPRARNQHLNAFETGQTCIDCHKGIAHKGVRHLLTDEELEKLEAPNPDFVRPIPEMFAEGLKRVEAKEAELAAQEKAEKEKEREAKIAAKKAEQARIEAAVAAALANQSAAATGAAPAAAGMGIDWGDVPAREITLFYPGQTSIEWALNGRDHGGARPFEKGGDRCVTCHDKETADMGQKMVTGEKAETTPIPGKRGSIPVNVQAAHDGNNLYMRFEWEASEHAPVPFAEGGKMDPENPMKLAMMLSTNDVEYAGEAGCWQTCHHDAASMPDSPEAAADSDAAKRLDLQHGVTKYLKESRSSIEVKGRRGKARGGWDNLKSDDEIQAALQANQFMDLLRYKSGKGETEDGYILEQRYMKGGQGFEVDARQEGSNWIVEIKRPLKSDKAGDVSIESGQLYNFGFAIHDDFSNARFHHVSLGYKLGLDSEEAEVNVVKREAASAPAAAAAAPAAAAGSGSSINVDWSKAGSREITLLYPGQTSIEWVLNGRDHGGARPFEKGGDRCVTCHDKEAADMGQKMVTGEKAETTPIPGKRGSIPVTVESTYDDENLYLRFTWPETEHAPVPFVDGGKMDPENPMKLAIMFSTSDVEYAGEAGCWQTCHHDAASMPDSPEAEAAAGSEAAKVLDLKQGVTKYLKESRSKIEVKGRRGKARGGWDQLKSPEEIQAAMQSNQFMDLLRFKSGKGETEDGYILEQRHMAGGQGFEVNAGKEAGNWVVTLKRKLVSEKAGDINFDTSKVYNFGFAIHDDFSSARFHHVSLGYHLGFDKGGEEVEVNAIKQ
ncbi:MAG: NapC/NirT family cytochrome c [Sedimenticola sp.]|nr:NapC/NirT family cytochrome c [Sedimenticola sp.]